MFFKHTALLVALAATVVAVQASADDCKRPTLRLVNDRGESIKVSKIQYFDGCDKTWRTESLRETEILGADGATHHYADFTDNLEHVGNCVITKFKVYRAIRQDKGSAYGAFAWGDEIVPSEGSGQKCNTGVRFTVHTHE
jgi:hypothetical protein